MNSQVILLLNIAGAAGFILWYAMSRGHGKRPTQLDMKAPDHSSKPASLPVKNLLSPSVMGKQGSYNPTMTKRVRPGIPQEKYLNVMFMYNSHSWDAYEVLGVPAGSSITQVTEAYQACLKKCDKESIEFLEAAFQAILKKVS